MSADNKPSIILNEYREQVSFDELVKVFSGMGLETRLEPKTSSFAKFEIIKENNDVNKVTIEVPRPNGRIARCFLSRHYGEGVGEPVAVYLGFASEFNPEELKEKHNIEKVEGVSVYGEYPLPIQRIQSSTDHTGKKNAIFFMCKPLPNQTPRVLNINQDGIIVIR